MQPLIVQKFIAGYEVEVPVIIYEQNPYILPPIVLYKNKGYSMEDAFLDFEDIYNDDYNFCLLEDINIVWNKKIKEEVYKIVELLELERYTRIDFRLTNCQTAHCGRHKLHFAFGSNTFPIVPYRHSPQALCGLTADCRSFV